MKKRNHEFEVWIQAEAQSMLSRWGTRGVALACLGWLLLVGFGCLSAQAQASKEYQLKAAFVYNFTKFVEWTTNSFCDDNTPIVIGVFANSRYTRELACSSFRIRPPAYSCPSPK